MVELATVVGSAIVIIGGAAAIVVGYNRKLDKALKALKLFFELVQEYLNARTDGNFTDAEYMEIGKKTVEIVGVIDTDPTIPITLSKYTDTQ